VNATGDITLADNASTNQHIAWSQSRRGNYMQTPLVYGDYLYCCNDAGILSCYEAKTGKSLYSERLGSGNTGFTASIVAADGKLYAASEEGLVFVVKAGPKFQVLSTNDLGETCMATPAISAGELFFRTRNHLMAISSKK
jgi:outer membrane protein assembly factor BamB